MRAVSAEVHSRSEKAFGEDVWAKMRADQFHWHRAARLFDGQGREQRPLQPTLSLIVDRPSSLALACALASAGQGFRIGGTGPAPAPDNAPIFETLTGGSTGAPRRIRRTQASWIASFGVNAGLFGIGPGSSVAVLGRLVHSLALYGAIEGLHLGASVHLLDTLRPDRQGRALVARKVTHLYATPTQLRLLAEGATPMPDLTWIIVGGSKLDPALRKRLKQIAPTAAVREFYGTAETSFITLSDPTTPIDSVGTPYPGVELDIRAGEIWVRSPYLFDGYASDTGVVRRENGWLSVGEMGKWQAEFLVLSGRAGRMVTVADQNVFPEEIEAFLTALPGIAEAAVIARPDGSRGQVLHAVLMGDPACGPAALSACRSRLGTLKAPKSFHFISDWPRLPSGKTDLASIQRVLP